MKLTRNIPIIVASACLICSGLSAGADSANETKPPRMRKGPPPSVEMQAYQKLVLAIYDTDKNGSLDETERSVLLDDIASGEMEPPPRPHAGRGHMGPPPEILALYDTDKDGTLNEVERTALEADIASGKLPPPPHGPKPDGETAPVATTPENQ